MTGSEEHVAEMMGHLHLTSKDAKVVVLEDESDEDLAHSDWAVIGKVLAPNVLHIQTIKSALRAAWGNPKDLVMSSTGNNTFMAEFASQADRTRVLEGSPWMVGRYVILLQNYDLNLKPSQLIFNKMVVWIRIMNLSLGWMTEHWGKTLAEQVGDVKKTDVDAQGHCWGIFMCMRVEVDVDKPLLRGITVYSNHKKTMEWYGVLY